MSGEPSESTSAAESTFKSSDEHRQTDLEVEVSRNTKDRSDLELDEPGGGERKARANGRPTSSRLSARGAVKSGSHLAVMYSEMVISSAMILK